MYLHGFFMYCSSKSMNLLFIALLSVLVVTTLVPGVSSMSNLLKSLDISSLMRQSLSLTSKQSVLTVISPTETTFKSPFLDGGKICLKTFAEKLKNERKHRNDHRRSHHQQKSSSSFSSTMKRPQPRRKYMREPYDSSKARSSQWYKDYVLSTKCENPESRKGKKFRRRFRMPYNEFKKLIDIIREENWFPMVEKVNCIGQLGNPLELLVLGALRYLGRGWTFDDLEEATGICEESHRLFFHSFVAAVGKHLYPKWVKIPETAEEISDCMAEFNEAGFHGCIGSADATHIVIEKCYKNLRNQHLGAKSSLTTRAFQITVNHRRKILATTAGLPGRWNDKTVIRFDGFLTSIRRGTLYQDITFQLFNAAGDLQSFMGVWILVDGGYLPWSCTVCPIKETESIKATRWSKWAESMRKDVECTFGILKGRWRILKTGIRIQNLTTVDNIWYTCCTFHNMLLNVDGLDERWKEGVRSPYEGELGYHDYSVATKNVVPLVFARANREANKNIRQFDISTVVEREPTIFDFTDEDDDEIMVVTENDEEVGAAAQLPIAKKVNSTNHFVFRTMLVDHFHYLWLHQQLVWPSRTGVVQMVPE